MAEQVCPDGNGDVSQSGPNHKHVKSKDITRFLNDFFIALVLTLSTLNCLAAREKSAACAVSCPKPSAMIGSCPAYAVFRLSSGSDLTV
jgi:hypothetical protein